MWKNFLPPVVHPWLPQNVSWPPGYINIDGAAMGSAVATGGLPWVVSTGTDFQHVDYTLMVMFDYDAIMVQ